MGTTNNLAAVVNVGVHKDDFPETKVTPPQNSLTVIHQQLDNFVQ